MTDEPDEFGAADLIGYGRVSWPELARLRGEAESAWADYDGFHIGHPPAKPPPYSHLWAWTGEWLLRARIDGGQAIVGVLALGGAPGVAPPHVTTLKVRYQRAAAATWPHNEKRVGPIAREIADRPVDTFLISGEQPVTFVAMPAGPVANDDRAK